VAATGTGKTMISAFDYKAFQSANPNARLLFVAHRLEILKQSIATFRAVLKDNNFGDLWVRNYKPDAYNHLFVSVQTLLNNIDTLDVDSSYYDFIIVDEVHHISASSYRPILEKFTPNILLGLTATPERHDGGDILEDFDNRIAAEIRLPEALNRKLLTPFQYFGISDNIDLSKANWTNGHYDSKELTSLFTKSKTRVRDIVDNLEKYLTDKEEVRALGFCVTQEHAKHMSDSFNSIGLKSDYLTSKNGNRRDELRSKFKSKEINYLFVVDIFNEGVDIPEIDTVLFLRPTESLTIFLQQLGRGLRLSDEKDVLTVLDFVSNSRPEYDFENKFRAIIGKTNNPVKKEVEDDFPHLPLGCSIVLEKKAKENILFNIEAATRYSKKDIINKIRIFRHNTELPLTLQNFTSFYNVPLQYIYKSCTWSELKYIAKVESHYSTINEKEMLSAIKNKWLSTESLSYFSFILKLAKNKFTIELNKLSEEEQHMSLMLYYDFWQEDSLHYNLENSINQIGKNEFFVVEIIELMETLIDRISFSESSIPLPYKQPLKLHSRYTRDQILAAFGKSTYQKKSSSREGVAENKELNTEMLFINLIKSEKDFSPSTLYDDYAINEKIFHWQSQNSAVPEKGKGLSYLEHQKNDKIILLFVREQNKDEFGNTMGYVFLGRANIKSHEGRRPMNIKWELCEPLPNYLWKASAKMSTS
jgi:superfamily II DNA or RNA helicase